jgi:hypothetical protein
MPMRILAKNADSVEVDIAIYCKQMDFSCGYYIDTMWLMCSHTFLGVVDVFPQCNDISGV